MAASAGSIQCGSPLPARVRGAALALVLAGSRPGVVKAVAAIDPVCDWNIEFDHADHVERDWLSENLGLPANNQGVYALRTPTTYAGVIDAPLYLLGTENAPAGRAAQLDGLVALLSELERPFTQDVAIASLPGLPTGGRRHSCASR